MPTYRFLNKDTNKEFDDFMSMSEREVYLKDNPNLRQVITPVAIAGDHLMGVGPKVDGGFTENMQRIAAAHPGSAMADRFGGSTQTHKEIKTRNTLSKHAKTVARDGFSANRKKTL